MLSSSDGAGATLGDTNSTGFEAEASELGVPVAGGSLTLTSFELLSVLRPFELIEAFAFASCNWERSEAPLPARTSPAFSATFGSLEGVKVGSSFSFFFGVW